MVQGQESISPFWRRPQPGNQTFTVNLHPPGAQLYYTRKVVVLICPAPFSRSLWTLSLNRCPRPFFSASRSSPEGGAASNISIKTKGLGLHEFFKEEFFWESLPLRRNLNMDGGRLAVVERWSQRKEITSFSLDAQRLSGLRCSFPLFHGAWG